VLLDENEPPKALIASHITGVITQCDINEKIPPFSYDLKFTDDGVEISNNIYSNIRIYNLSGKLVVSATGENTLMIDRKTLSATTGTYFFHLTRKNGTEQVLRVIYSNNSIHVKYLE